MAAWGVGEDDAHEVGDVSGATRDAAAAELARLEVQGRLPQELIPSPACGGIVDLDHAVDEAVLATRLQEDIGLAIDADDELRDVMRDADVPHVPSVLGHLLDHLDEATALPDDAAYAVAKDVWQRGASLGIYALVDRVAALADKIPLGRTHPWELSLVEIAKPDGRHSVEVVKWSRPSSYLGRHVRVMWADGFGNDELQWTSHFKGSEVSFDDGVVVHPAIGVHLRRSVEGRAILPAAAKRLLLIWNNVSQCADAEGEVMLPADTLEDCALCHEDDGRGLRQCALCCCAWHSSCCQLLAARMVDGRLGDALPPLPPGFDLRNAFGPRLAPDAAVVAINRAICAACRAWACAA